jgi:hypothetical protein
LLEALEELALGTCFPKIYTTMEILFKRKRRGELRRLKKVALHFHRLSKEQILQDWAGMQCELDGQSSCDSAFEVH